MTNEEKRKLAIARELDELAAVARSFATLAREAERQTEELNRCFSRLNRIARDAELERKIDEADYLFRRGRYAYLRGDGPSNLQREHTCHRFLRLIK